MPFQLLPAVAFSTNQSLPMLYPSGTIMCLFAVGSSFDALWHPILDLSLCSSAPGKAQHAPYEPRAAVGEGAVLFPGAEVVSTCGGVGLGPSG